MFALYFDEDSTDWRLINSLRARGIDVISALEVNMLRRDDDEQLDFATAQNRVICSFNIRDFNRIHKEYMEAGKEHAGIILVQQQQFSVGEYVRRIQSLMAQKSIEEMHNWIEFLSGWG
jgi:hypothetical protein